MKCLIWTMGVFLSLSILDGCDRSSRADGTIALHLTVRSQAWRTKAYMNTYVIRARAGDELVERLYLREIVSDTSVYLRLTDSSPAFFYHGRRFPEVSDSILIGLQDVAFQKDDGNIDGTTFDYSIRVDTSDYAQHIADCDSVPCRVETTERENPYSWTFHREWYHANGEPKEEWTEIYRDRYYSRHGWRRTYNFEGQLHQEIEYDSGAPVGLYRRWHTNGQLEVSGRHVKGGTRSRPLRDGVWTFWDSTGRECGRGVFDSGTGEVRTWYAGSSPWKAEFWKNGEEDSVWYEWYQSGAAKIVNDRRPHSDSAGDRLYSPEGRLDNKARDWYANGQMRKENGREFYREWYPNGTKKLESVRIPVQEKQRTAYTRHGRHTVWFPDSSVRITGQYDNGYRCGVWTEWSQDGIKLAERSYPERDTLMVSKFEEMLTTFHRNGQPASRGMCSYSSPYEPKESKIGTWAFWNEAGQLIRTEEWVGGIVLYLGGVRTIP